MFFAVAASVLALRYWVLPDIERYRPLIDALYSGRRNGRIETEITFEDGRRSHMRAELEHRLRPFALHAMPQRRPDACHEDRPSVAFIHRFC